MSEYKLVKDYPIENYKCGLKASDKIELVRDIIKDHNKKNGENFKKGEIWIVLPAAKKGNQLLQADGMRHTWDDDNTIFDACRRA